MRRTLGLLLVALMFGATGAHATTIMFDMDCVVGNGTCTPTASFGTVTLTDESGGVRVSLALTNAGQRIQSFDLNYNDTKYSNATTFGLTGTTVSVDENGQKAGSYGFFDLEIPGSGNLGNVSSFSGLLTTSSGVTVADLNRASGAAGIYGAIHVGSCGPNNGTCVPGVTGNNSIWLGFTPSGNSGGGGSGGAPEPASIALFGLALTFGAARLARRSK